MIFLFSFSFLLFFAQENKALRERKLTNAVIADAMEAENHVI